jgi:hypothetical protein
MANEEETRFRDASPIEVKEEARRQSILISESPFESEDQAFIDAASAPDTLRPIPSEPII